MSGAMSSGTCIMPLNILPYNPDDNRISGIRAPVGKGLRSDAIFIEQWALLHKNEA